MRKDLKLITKCHPQETKKSKLNSNQAGKIINIKVDNHKIEKKKAHKSDKTKSSILDKSNQRCMPLARV